MYVPTTQSPKCIKQILTDIKGETDNNTIIVGDFFNTPPTSMNIQTEYQEENNSPSGTLSDRLNLINIYMILQPKTAEYTFFSSAHECSPA